MADWLIRLLDAAGVAEAGLVGHSMGSLVALEAAVLAPKRIRRLALLGVAAQMPVHPDLLKAAQEDARLAAHLREARARAYAVSEHPHRGLCETCPGRGGLCSWDDLHTLREAPVAGAEEPLRSGAAGLV